MLVYIAANYAADRARAQEIGELLWRDHGHRVTEPWWDSDVSQLEAATRDRRGVMEADVVVAIMEEPREWKGLWVEIGMALRDQKQVIVLGDEGRSCVFLTLPEVRRVASVAELVEFLR